MPICLAHISCGRLGVCLHPWPLNRRCGRRLKYATDTADVGQVFLQNISPAYLLGQALVDLLLLLLRSLQLLLSSLVSPLRCVLFCCYSFFFWLSNHVGSLRLRLPLPKNPISHSLRIVSGSVTWIEDVADEKYPLYMGCVGGMRTWVRYERTIATSESGLCGIRTGKGCTSTGRRFR